MISERMRELVRTGSAIRKMWQDGLRLKEAHGPENVADATLGNPVAPPPPELLAALEDVVANPPPGLHRYTPNAGLPPVRERVAAHLDGRGLLPGARAEHVVMTAGASAAVNVALRTVLDPGEEVLLLAPFFPDYPAHVLNHGGVPVVVPTTDDFLPDLAAIEAAISPRTRAVIVNHPNNPSGRQYPEPLLRDLAALLADRSRAAGRPFWLLSDEPYRDIRYVGEPFTSPASLYEHGLMAYSFSKSHSVPGERIGYLAVNPACPGVGEVGGALALANRILGFTNAPVIWQHVIARCLDVSVDVEIYRRHRDRLVAALRDKGYDLTEPDGAFYLYPRTPGGDDDAFVARAMKDLLLVVPGGTFARPGHFRVAFCVDDRTADQIVDRLPLVR
jgi:aspartate aminotransferase